MCVLLASDGAIVRNKGSEFVVLHEFFFFFTISSLHRTTSTFFFLLLLLLSECHINKKKPKTYKSKDQDNNNLSFL